MLKEVLEKRERILGNRHCDTTKAKSDLAIALRYARYRGTCHWLKLSTVATIQREVLETRSRSLGQEHPETITALSHLA